MALANWGKKRICYQCLTKFYDFGKKEIVCPECATVINPEEMFRKKIRMMHDKSTVIETDNSSITLEHFDEIEIEGEDPESALIGVIEDDDEVSTLSIEN